MPINRFSTVFKRYARRFFKTLLIYSISLFFVQLPCLGHALVTLGQETEKSKLQKRIRAQRVDPGDPSSPYRAVEVLDGLRTTPDEHVQTLADIPDYCAERYADRETLGVREILGVEDEKQANGKIFKKFVLGEYKFSNYRQTFARIENIGRGLLSLGAKRGERILIFAETRPEWLLSAFAAFRHGLTVVTLYSTLGEEAVKHGINESQVSIILTSNELLTKLEKILDATEKVRHVIHFPPAFKSQSVKIPKSKNDIQFLSLTQLEDNGQNAQIDENLLKQRPKSSDVAVIMYTSGSTGTPKGSGEFQWRLHFIPMEHLGVLIKHENIVAAMTGEIERVFPMINVESDVYIAYLPLAHILELSCELLVYYMGIKCGYSSPQTLTDQSTAIKRGEKGDLQVLRPHIMCCVPTILDRVHRAVNEKINQSNLFRRLLLKFTYLIKVKRLEAGLESPILNKLIFHRMNDMVLGGRVKTMLCGGAVLSEDTQRFVQAALCVTLFQGYGLTETCAAATIADQFDSSVGRAGYPLISCEIRLVNWEEGHYRNTDEPNPRGEVLIGGKVVADGYFAGAAKENVNFEEIAGTRYFSTGDIAEIFPNGTLKIIDRKKDLVKLRGGEYVSLAKVETVISKFPIVDNCCLCAAASAEYTVLLISPNPKQLTSYVQKHFDESDWQTVVNEAEFQEQVLSDIQEVCRKGGIERFEVPQRVKIVKETWTPETGLVTDALKLKRKAIEQKYRRSIAELYSDKPASGSSSTKKIKKATQGSDAPVADGNLLKKDQ